MSHIDVVGILETLIIVAIIGSALDVVFVSTVGNYHWSRPMREKKKKKERERDREDIKFEDI